MNERKKDHFDMANWSVGLFSSFFDSFYGVLKLNVSFYTICLSRGCHDRKKRNIGVTAVIRKGGNDWKMRKRKEIQERVYRHL